VAALIYTDTPPQPSAEEMALLTADARQHMSNIAEKFQSVDSWNKETLTSLVKTYLAENALKMPELGKPLRIALTGRLNAPGIYDILETLGQNLTCQRLYKI